MSAFYFILGIVVGIMLLMGSVVITILVEDPSTKTIKKLKSRPKGEVFNPKSYKELRTERIIKQNNEEGKDTPLSEIL